MLTLAIAALTCSFRVPDARDAYAAAYEVLRQDGMPIAVRIRQGRTQDLPKNLPQGLSATMTPLAAIRWQSKSLVKVLALVEKGNNLPYEPPPPPTLESSATNFPNIASARSIAKAMNDYGLLKLSEGKSSEAVRALEATSRMCFRSADESVVSYLSAVGVDDTLLGQVNNFLADFSLADWVRLEQLAARRIFDTALYGRILDNEFRMFSVYDAEMRKELPTAALLQTSSDEESTEFKDAVTDAYFRALTMPRWQKILDQVVDLRRSRFGLMKQSLLGPETDWTFRSPDDLSELPKVIRSDSDVVRALADVSYLNPLDIIILRSRAKFRLLSLHGKINRYYLNRHRYPNELKDVANEAEKYDPLSRKPFVYQKLKNGYKLVSAGRKGLTGEVGLEYRWPPSTAKEGKGGTP